MRYFRLLDDVHVPGRWHLGEVFDGDSKMPLVFIDGAALSSGIRPRVKTTTAGVPLDFCLTSFSVPIVTTRLAENICSIAKTDIQRFAIDINEGKHSNFEALNVTRLAKCLDEKRSTFMKWTEKDQRPDRISQYRMVTELKIDAKTLSPEMHFFRIKGWSIAIIVSEHIKFAMEKAGCLGAKFQEVT